MSWELVPLGDMEMLDKIGKMMGAFAPTCGMTDKRGMEAFVARKKCDLYYLNDGENEIVLGFKWSNGLDMWCISQLAFNGSTDFTKVAVKIQEGILNFMKQRNVDKVYAVRPTLNKLSAGDQFYEKLKDMEYWKINTVLTSDKPYWLLKKEEAVSIKTMEETK
jgi:hypothetical protein